MGTGKEVPSLARVKVEQKKKRGKEREREGGKGKRGGRRHHRRTAVASGSDASGDMAGELSLGAVRLQCRLVAHGERHGSRSTFTNIGTTKLSELPTIPFYYEKALIKRPSPPAPHRNEAVAGTGSDAHRKSTPLLAAGLSHFGSTEISEFSVFFGPKFLTQFN